MDGGWLFDHYCSPERERARARASERESQHPFTETPQLHDLATPPPPIHNGELEPSAALPSPDPSHHSKHAHANPQHRPSQNIEKQGVAGRPRPCDSHMLSVYPGLPTSFDLTASLSPNPC